MSLVLKFCNWPFRRSLVDCLRGLSCLVWRHRRGQCRSSLGIAAVYYAVDRQTTRREESQLDQPAQDQPLFLSKKTLQNAQNRHQGICLLFRYQGIGSQLTGYQFISTFLGELDLGL